MAKIKSGGGYTSNKLVRKGVKAGPRQSTNVASVAATDMLGQQIAFKRPEIIKRAAPDFAPLGNALVNNVGKGGPGAGRTTHHCGSQGTHGATSPGARGFEGTADRGSRTILNEQGNRGGTRRGQEE